MKNITFLNKALQFISTVWSETNEKYTQSKIAEKLNCTTAYLSKAKTNENYAKLLKPKLISIIEELEARYIEDENVFIDKNGKLFKIQDATIAYGLHKMDSKWLRKIFSKKTKTLRILTTWLGEAYEDIIQELNSKPELLRKVDKIQILISNPESLGLMLRSKSMGINLERGFNKTKEDLHNLVDHHNILTDILASPKYKHIKRPDIEIRMHAELPSLQLIITDTQLFLGFYLQKESSKNVENLILNRDGSSFVRKMENHFDTIWRKYEQESLRIDDIQSKLEEFKIPPYRRFNSLSYKKLEGTFRLYFPEKYSFHHDFRENKIATSIGCNILTISRKNPMIDNSFHCSMKAIGVVGEDRQEYLGQLQNTNYNNPDYALLKLTNKTKTRYFIILISTKEQEPNTLHGLFTLIYKASGKIGSGYAVLNKVNKKNIDIEQEKPISINPLKLTEKYSEHNEFLKPHIVNYLINKRESLLTSPLIPLIEDENEMTIADISATYYVYAYNDDKKNPKIIRGVLSLFETGMIKYKNQKSGGYHGVGWARIDTKAGKGMNHTNLYIEITNSNPDINRSGLFILHIKKAPLKTRKNSSWFYYGISASTKWNEGEPLAAKIVMELIEDVEEKGGSKFVKGTNENFIKYGAEKKEADIFLKELPDEVKKGLRGGGAKNIVS